MYRQQTSRAQPDAQPTLPSGQAQGRQHVPPSPLSAALKGPQGSIELGSSIVSVGRSPANQLKVNDPDASWFHAQICPQEQSHIVVDLESRNGTFVNGQKLPPNTPHRLNVNDTVRFGNTTFTYMTDASAHPPKKESPPIPSGAPVSTMDSQPGHPKAQPNNHQQRQVHPRQKLRRPTSKEVTVALISTVGVIVAAIITAVMGPILSEHSTGGASTATPTVITTPSIPHLRSSYTGSYTVTSTNFNVSPSAPITFFSIDEDDQGRVQSNMALGSAKYTCQGSVDTSRNLQLTCTKVGDVNYHVIVKGLVSQDSGHLSGTWSLSDWKYPSSYVDATWFAQG
jgi:hypothetical protein